MNCASQFPPCMDISKHTVHLCKPSSCEKISALIHSTWQQQNTPLIFSQFLKSCGSNGCKNGQQQMLQATHGLNYAISLEHYSCKVYNFAISLEHCPYIVYNYAISLQHCTCMVCNLKTKNKKTDIF